MRVALLADVHANLHALEAVLAEVRGAGCASLWLAGDWVGYGAFPDETVTLLRAAGAVGVTGDMDREVLAAGFGSLPAAARSEKRLALEWTAQALSPPTTAFLGELPEQRRLPIGETGEALLVHGSPAAVGEHLWPHTPDERLIELARRAAARLVICGHTHAQMDREAAGTRFVNPGSVGRPGDGDPRAAWGLLEVDDGGLRFEPRRVVYDHLAAAAAVRERGLPEAVSRMLAEGRSLKTVLGEG
jgi:predicted phosphodiesterase